MRMSIRSFLRCFTVAALACVLATANAKQPAKTGWVKHENLAPVTGDDGKLHAATCSKYPGTDGKFSFWTKQGTSKNVAVFFEGGGACWDNFTCSFPISSPLPPGIPPSLQFFVPSIDPTSTPASYDGIFDANNPDNPVRDWSIVYIPYCTGDLHTGSTTKSYFSAGNPYLPQSFAIEHRGFDNFMVVLDWMKKNIVKPKNVLVTGSSAGGYGATANFPWIERTFGNAHTYVIADASQGVTVPAFDTGNPGRNSWNMQLAPWVFGADPSAISGADLFKVAAKANPRVKTAQFTTAYDGVQILFYDVMKQLYGDAGTCANPAIDWNHQMVDTLQSYTQQVPNFRYYLAEGSYHTLLRSPLFYTEASAGIKFSQWVEDMLSNRGGTGGHGGNWDNVACAACQVRLLCPPATVATP